MVRITQENHAHLATTTKAIEGTRVAPEAERNAKRGEDISIMKQ
jgi:hypothetical protein